MLAVYRTSTGNVRTTNEDAYLVDPGGLYVVADGMGGHRAGEVASKLAVDTIDELLRGKVPTPRGIRDAIETANARIRADAGAIAAHSGMGTTLTAVWVGETSVLIAQVGDSRAYLLRDKMLYKCTRDHSLIDELLRTHAITPEQARYHPDRGVITRALGVKESVKADVFEWDRKADDIWLICSDGLTDMLDDAQIGAILRSHDISDAADILLAMSLEQGGNDNITFIILSDDDFDDGIIGGDDSYAADGYAQGEVPSGAYDAAYGEDEL